jgi:hypothetical protein
MLQNPDLRYVSSSSAAWHGLQVLKIRMKIFDTFNLMDDD